MDVTINGEHRTVAEPTTVRDVVRSLTTATGGIAVAVNDEVVPKAGWDGATIAHGDRVDVLTAVQGG